MMKVIVFGKEWYARVTIYPWREHCVRGIRPWKAICNVWRTSKQWKIYAGVALRFS